MLVVAIIATLLVIGLGGAVYSTNKLRGVTRRKKEWGAADAFIMSAGAGGVSLVELYLASDQHEEALASLQRVYSNAIPADASPTEWAAYFEGKVDAGERSVQGVVSAWQGSLAEEELVNSLNAAPLLQEHGLTAHRFDTPNHPDTDIYYTDANGHVLTHTQVEDLGLPEQVKNYAADNYHNFLAEVHQNPDAVYAVNSELFEKLSANGTLDRLDTHVVDGGFSSEALQTQAKNVVGDFHEGLDISEDIPFVALAVFGAKTAKNLHAVATGQLTTSEATVNVGGDVVRVGVGGLAAVGGAKAGALLGSFLMPGVGTLVGGIAGALAGGLGVGKLLNIIKERLKYGDIIDACERIGRAYYQAALTGAGEVRLSVEHAILSIPKLEEMLHRERALASTYAVPTRVTAEARPTPSQALVLRGVHEIERQLRVARRAVPNVVQNLGGLVRKLDQDRDPRRGYGFLGWLVASQADYLLAGCPAYAGDVELARRQAVQFPHHPYRLRKNDGSTIDEAAFLKTVVAESVREADQWESRETPFWQQPPVSLWAVLLLSIFLALSGGLGAYDLHRGGEFSRAVRQGFTSMFSAETKAPAIVEPVATPTQVERVRVVAGALNMRAEPSGSAAVLSTVRRNEEATVLEKSGGWARIKTEMGVTGWVSLKYLANVGSPTLADK